MKQALLAVGLLISATVGTFILQSQELLFNEAPDPNTVILMPGNVVRLYSIEGCGVCERRKREFKQVGLPFQEIRVERDLSKDDFWSYLRNQGHEGDEVAFPVIEVNGKAQVNPSWSWILSRLRLRKS